MEIERLSGNYRVKRLGEPELGEIYELCAGNPQYYRHMDDGLSMDGCRRDLTALPPGKTQEDKYFLGYYEGNKLAAIMDLILAYPDSQTALIGLFMVDAAYQSRGVGSGIVSALAEYLKEQDFRTLRLGYVEDNAQSRNFWLKNGFTPNGEDGSVGSRKIIVLERNL